MTIEKILKEPKFHSQVKEARLVLPEEAKDSEILVIQVHNETVTRIYFSIDKKVWRVDLDPVKYTGYEFLLDKAVERFTLDNKLYATYKVNEKDNTLEKYIDGEIKDVYYYNPSDEKKIPKNIRDMAGNYLNLLLCWSYKNGSLYSYWNIPRGMLES